MLNIQIAGFIDESALILYVYLNGEDDSSEESVLTVSIPCKGKCLTKASTILVLMLLELAAAIAATLIPPSRVKQEGIECTIQPPSSKSCSKLVPDDSLILFADQAYHRVKSRGHQVHKSTSPRVTKLRVQHDLETASFNSEAILRRARKSIFPTAHCILPSCQVSHPVFYCSGCPRYTRRSGCQPGLPQMQDGSVP